jgi:hypothetical protein
MLSHAMPLSLRTPPREPARPRQDTVDDSIEVPAAVICAICGDALCGGCESEKSRSGIVAMVAWERSEAPVASRLWATARAATLNGEAFFELLPDGPIAPALRFALVAELIAAAGFAVSSLFVVAAIAPSWVKHVALDVVARQIAFRVGIAGVPALALLLVVAHAIHGLALDRGARKVGARANRSRALRFGLYATGWDLVIGPIGGVLVALKDGVGAAFGLLGLGVSLPARCSRAFLRGCYRLEGVGAETARATSTAAAIVATIVGAVAILAAIVALVLATG